MRSSEELLTEILTWTRVGFYASAKGILLDVLDNDKKRAAYQAADGLRSQEDIRVQTKVGSNVLSELFKQCINLGLMTRLEGGRAKRLFDLTTFGLMPVGSAEERTPNDE